MKLIQITDTDRKLLEEFSCLFSDYTSEDLRKDHEKIDIFLKEEATTHHLNHYVRTYLLLNETEDKVIGFFSLFNDEIKVTNGKRSSLKFKGFTIYRPETDIYPSIRLHQFAINNEFQGKFYQGIKYSDYLMGHVLATIKEVAAKSGCMFIGLEATDNSLKFYKSFNFIEFKKKDNNKLPFLIFKVADLFE
ncbi:hypothetical protein UACE39S_01424 [Ureibacillus acetophenoni]